MDYRPPVFRQPQQFNGSLDGIFEQYMAMKAQKEQGARQDFSDTVQFGTPIRNLSPEQLERGAQPPFTPSGPTQTGQPMAPQFDNDPHVAAIQKFLESKRQSSSLASQTQKAELGLTQAKTINELSEAGGKAGARGTKAEGELRGELQTLSKPFVQVRDSMGRIRAAANNPTAAGDLALIFNYMKVLDPGSTVREGEFATAQNSAGVPERLKAKYNQVIRGERLADDQRADFVSRAEDLYKSQESIQKQQEEQYRGLAGRMGANPENVILDQSLPKTAAGKIRVSNGRETLLIDAADEADAARDGYARAK